MAHIRTHVRGAAIRTARTAAGASRPSPGAAPKLRPSRNLAASGKVQGAVRETVIRRDRRATPKRGRAKVRGRTRTKLDVLKGRGTRRTRVARKAAGGVRKEVTRAVRLARRARRAAKAKRAD